MRALLRLVAGRLVGGLATIVVVSVLVFAATEILPGDAATVVLGRDATPTSIKAFREKYGLESSIVAQYGHWLRSITRGDFGTSFAMDAPVTAVLGKPLRNSALLVLLTLAFLVPLSLILGTVAGLRQGSRLDVGIQVATLTTAALPEFVIGIALVISFAVLWPLLPAVSFDVTLRSLILPAATLVIIFVGYMARMVRAGVVEVLGSDFVAMARLKGLPENVVIRRHVLPNSLVPTVQAFALITATLASGLVIVEYLFSFPGIGQTLVRAVSTRDIPVVQAIALMIAVLNVVANLVADLFAILATPRLRTRL